MARAETVSSSAAGRVARKADREGSSWPMRWSVADWGLPEKLESEGFGGAAIGLSLGGLDARLPLK